MRNLALAHFHYIKMILKFKNKRFGSIYLYMSKKLNL